MLDAFTSLRLSLTRRIETLEGRVPDVLHGVVETVNPLSVRLADGSLVTNVSSLDPSLRVTNRVRLLAYGGFLTGRRLLVIGRADAPYQGRIPAGSNLNNYVTPGQWYNPENLEVAGFTNGPPNSQAGALIVLEAAGVIQYWHDYDASGNVWRRRLYNGAWSPWAWFGGQVGQQTFTPVWTQSGGAVLAIGNGTLTCRYTKIDRQMIANYFFLRGSTTNVGSNAYIFSMPWAAYDYRTVSGSGYINRGGTIHAITVMGVNTSQLGLVLSANGSRLSNTVPSGWAEGDFMSWSVSVPVA